MSSRPCIGGCGATVSGKRKRCPDCRRSLRALAEKRRYHSARDQDVTDYDHVDLPVVSYADGGEAAPRLAPPRAGQNIRHDTARRVAADYAASMAEEDLPEVTSWEELSNREPDNRAYFPPSAGSPAGGFFGQSDRPHGPEVSPAAGGNVYQPRPRVQSFQNYQAGRFGPSVEMPPALHSAHFDSNVPVLQAREAAQVEQQRMASEHARSQGPSWRGR